MGKRFDYEYAVIGGGTAGLTAARQLAEAGRKVALIEQDKLGGPQSGQHDALLKELEGLGVAYVSGRAQFTSHYDLKVGEDKQISASKFVIATGTQLDTNGISGVEKVPYYTAASVRKLKKAPHTVLVVGGGRSGCETAQYLAQLGAKVVIVEMSSRLLPKEDEEVGNVMKQYLEKRHGIKTFVSTRATMLEQDKISTRVVFMVGGQEKTVRVEAVVLTTGTKPALDIGLKEAGVSFDKHGVIVDRTLQTSARNVFAAGDILSGDGSTERAIYTAEVAVMNMLERNKTFVNYDGFMRITNTTPQIATVGMTEDELTKHSKKYKSAMVPLSAVSAATANNFRIGFLKIMSDAQGNKILGATMIGPHAADVLQEISLAIRHNIPLIQIASAPHPADEWGYLVKLATRKILLK